MPFKHLVDKEKNIVVLKAKGNESPSDIISEIQAAIDSKRGMGITRRLIDITELDLVYSFDHIQKILKM